MSTQKKKEERRVFIVKLNYALVDKSSLMQEAAEKKE